MDPAQLIFLIGAPRSGTTLLQRMLGSHTQIHTHPEPHVMTPLAYLGFYQAVDAAPYDHINAAKAFREFVEELPGGEGDYLDALRRFADTLYTRALEPSHKGYFLDKTPAYALLLPFLCRVFPTARYIVLTRHPLAILHSVAHSFFGGDYAAAQTSSPVVSQYVPAIAAMLRQPAPPHVHVRYEDLVSDPPAHMRHLLQFVGLPYEPQVVEYGKQQHISKSYGDPVSVGRHSAPVTDSLTTWAADLNARPEAMAIAQRVVAALDPADLQQWGYPPAQLWNPCGQATKSKTRRRRLDSYQLQRWAVLATRKRIKATPLEAALRKVRYACDVLLRS